RKVCSVNGRAQEALGSLTRTAALCHGRPCEETVGPKLRGSPCKHRRLRTTPTLCRLTDLESVPRAMTGGAAEVSALVRVTAQHDRAAFGFGNLTPTARQVGSRRGGGDCCAPWRQAADRAYVAS